LKLSLYPFSQGLPGSIKRVSGDRGPGDIEPGFFFYFMDMDT
jgi:hypothetical protein